MVFLRDHEDGCLIAVLVVPNASRDEIVGVHGDDLRIRVAAAPERGKANVRAARMLSAMVGRPVELVRGSTARRKVFLVRGRSREQIIAAATFPAR